MTLIVEKLTGKGKLDDFSGQLGTLAYWISYLL